MLTNNLSKAHETRDSLEQFLFAGCPSLSPFISLQVTFEVYAAAKIAKTLLKPPILMVQSCSKSSMLNQCESVTNRHTDGRLYHG